MWVVDLWAGFNQMQVYSIIIFVSKILSTLFWNKGTGGNPKSIPFLLRRFISEDWKEELKSEALKNQQFTRPFSRLKTKWEQQHFRTGTRRLGLYSVHRNEDSRVSKPHRILLELQVISRLLSCFPGVNNSSKEQVVWCTTESRRNRSSRITFHSCWALLCLQIFHPLGREQAASLPNRGRGPCIRLWPLPSICWPLGVLRPRLYCWWYHFWHAPKWCHHISNVAVTFWYLGTNSMVEVILS